MELWGIVVAILLGALIGLQREFSQQKENIQRFAGFRTFILFTLFGAILGYFSESFSSIPVIIGFIGIIVLVAVSYVLSYMKTKDMSATTEISAILAYVIGAMCTIGEIQLAVILGILVTAFLTFKERFHDMVRKMEKKELFAVVSFALISLVVLPILPNKNYSPMDLPGLGQVLNGIGLNTSFLTQLNVFNPSHIWLMVILVAGISFLGYFLVKLVGSKKGYGVLGFIGGLASSTAVTLSMAGESKKHRGDHFPFVLAVIIATAVTFIRIIFEVAVVNDALLPTLFLPMISMSIAGFLVAFIFFKRKRKVHKAKEIPLTQPFAIKPALKFALLFVLILFVSKIAQMLFGSTGIYVTSILSGLADVDAITLSMSALSKSGAVSNFVATTAIILAAASNTLVKAGIAYFLGDKKFGKIIIGVFLFILVVGMLVLFL
ncbi:MgtC/SapB family protein [archaeon]|jgi:uncharacterized membrane protein (DUF4010 family)|nr:MgtC/SapB family protein [archaeon]